MKKILFLALLISTCLPSLAQDTEFNLDAPPDANFMGQKQITDQDFEKTMKHLESKQKKNKKKKLKGTPLKIENDIQDMKGFTEEPNILNLSVSVILDNGDEIPSGHYKVVGKKTRHDTFVEFQQGHSIIAKIPVTEIAHDFDEKDVQFVKIIPIGQNQIKLIYGSLDFNAYTVLHCATID